MLTNMNCPNCNVELALTGMEPNGGYCIQHYKCLLCQKEFVQEIGPKIKDQLTELVEIREVEPELIPEEIEE